MCGIPAGAMRVRRQAHYPRLTKLNILLQVSKFLLPASSLTVWHKKWQPREM